MKVRFNVLLSIVAVCFLASCSVGRYLDTPAYVYIEGVDNITVVADANKYIHNSTNDDYRDLFFKELDESLESYNIVPVYEVPTNVQKYFKLEIGNLRLYETFRVEEIYPDSTYIAPEIYNLSICDVSSDFTVYKSGASGWYHLKDKSVVFSKEEEVSNNRTFFQVLFGLNKDNSVYTYHELSSDIFNDLARKCARRIAAKTSTYIDKEIN